MAVQYTTDNIDAYMRDIRRYDILTAEEEAALAARIHTGTPEEAAAARDRLICCNLRLVVKIAHDFKRYHLGFSDLVAEGNLGLMTAAEKFDASRGVRFSCYAAWWIKQSMRRAVAWQSRVIRIPGQSAQRVINISKARAACIAEHGREPTLQELCSVTGLSEVQVSDLLHSATESVSLDEPVAANSATTFEQMLSESLAHEDRGSTLQGTLHRALDGLSDLDRYIVQGTFGIGRSRMTRAALALETGISVTRIHSRLGDILDALRAAIAHGGDPQACSSFPAPV